VPKSRSADPPPRGHRLVEHTADGGFEVWGPTLGDLYAEAAVALFALMGRPTTLARPMSLVVNASGIDREDLLVRLLSELLARFELEGFFATAATCLRVEARAGVGARATLRCEGGRVDARRESGLAAIKAVTYHGLSVRADDGGFRARVFVDV
jgi:SHS2 domain-containing protein